MHLISLQQQSIIFYYVCASRVRCHKHTIHSTFYESMRTRNFNVKTKANEKKTLCKKTKN